jgi:trigger factor
MKMNNKDKDDKFIEDNYAKSVEELTWHLAKEQFVKAYEIKVDDNDVKNMAIEATRAQFGQYGMANIPNDVLERYATESLKKKEQVDSLVNRCIEVKLTASLKDALKPKAQEISLEDFNKLLA